MLLHPRRNFLDLGIIVRFGTVVAFDPAANLPFQIPFRPSQIGQTYGCVVDTVQFYEILNEGFAEPPCFFSWKVQPVRQGSANEAAAETPPHLAPTPHDLTLLS